METTSVHMGDGQLLSQLLQEAENDSSIDDNEHDRELSSERQLQQMLENYQSQVLKSTQHLHHVNGHDVHKINGGGGGGMEGSSRMRINAANGHSSVVAISHSQPCLYVTSEQKYEPNGSFQSSHYPHSSDPRDENGVAHSAVDVATLQAENSLLRQRVEILQKNTKILRNLEMAARKQEKLEQSVRIKLEQRLQQKTNENQLLQRQVEKLNVAVVQHPQMDPEHLHHYNLLMTDLVPQNKELMAIKERQQMEIEAQNATLEEQRNHIEILESALKNAQERLATKDRAAADAIALVDKVAHQQKLVQETLDEKQKMQDEYERQKAQLEMEVAQLKVQLVRPTTPGRGNAGRSTDGEEVLKLRKSVQSKDERIAQLEATVRELQKKHAEDLQRNDRVEMEVLMNKIRLLETEKNEKEQRIQDLLGREAADPRPDLRQLMSTNPSGAASSSGLNGLYSPPLYGHADAAAHLRQSMGSVPTSTRAAVLDDSGALKMEEMRQRIVERRMGAANSWLLSRQQRPIRPTYSSPMGTAAARMASKMPPASHYIDSLPAATRRRFANAAEQNGTGKLTKRTAIALGASGYRRSAWNSSGEGGGPSTTNRSFEQQKRPSGELHAPPTASNASTSSTDGESSAPPGRPDRPPEVGSLTSVVEVNRDHLSTREDFKRRVPSVLKNASAK
ncbi:hypothetical protein M3Y99_01293600 [Aphelenchoides fujianensis]|nr:hypothetical protein M3Y99_01293600 [Aphelenchoides fujianensis]